jgi:two-component system phosphate regulon sensor histidine kinase PhoR
MPIVDMAGECAGLVRCANRMIEGAGVRNFTDEDLAILDHVLQVAIPHIIAFRSEKEQKNRLVKVTHELKRPVSALVGVLANLEFEWKERMQMLPIPPFRHDYIGDAASWSELLRLLVTRSDFFAADKATLNPIRNEALLLLRDIVAPTIRQLSIELRDRRLPSSGIRASEFREIPKLFVDRRMFQQVFFNLLDNAIKYHDPDEPFWVEIQTSDEGDHYQIRIRDNGIGIDERMGKRIFKLGTRGSNAFQYNVQGTGIGLWVVKRLLELHGCSIEVTKYRRPTQFTIRLPKALRNPPREENARRQQELT